MEANIARHLQHGSVLQRDIARTLLYFDIFHHPLRVAEIHQFLPSQSVSIDDIQNACSSEPLRQYLVRKNEFICFSNSIPNYIDERHLKERRALRMWNVAVLMSHIIRRFPFVRGVFVSGELSKGVASKNSDIDFFIITAHGRVWITRTLFTLFKKTILLNRRKLFCYNHITSELNLEIKEQNIYTAIEVATLRPLYNLHLYDEFMTANSWIKNYLPNAPVPQEGARSQGIRKPWSEKMLTSILSRKQLDILDRRLLLAWRSLWNRRYAFLNPEKRNELFRSELEVSTAYVNDFLAKITYAYRRRLEQFGLANVNER